jgi:hypothetical protein
MQNEITLEATMAAFGQKTTIAGAGTTGAAWLLSNEGLGFLGLVVAVAGLLVNVYFKRKEDARQQSLYEAELRNLNGGGHVDK